MVILTIAGFFTILGEAAVTMYLQAQLAYRKGFLSYLSRPIAPSMYYQFENTPSQPLKEILRIIIIEDRILQRQ